MRRLIPLVLLLPLVVGGCGKDHLCPTYRAESGISVNATAFVTAHPGTAKICVDEGLCVVPASGQPASVFDPVDETGDHQIQVTITGADGKTLLSSKVTVPVKSHKVAGGCSAGSVNGSVTIGADGRMTTS